MKTLMTNKQSMLKRKWKTYHDQVEKYNTSWPSEDPLVNYTLEEIKSLSFDNTFWNFGHLTHPDEKWAVDKATQKGIGAYRLFCRCEEELRRISQEIRQMLSWALVTGTRIQDVRVLLETG